MSENKSSQLREEKSDKQSNHFGIKTVKTFLEKIQLELIHNSPLQRNTTKKLIEFLNGYTDDQKIELMLKEPDILVEIMSMWNDDIFELFKGLGENCLECIINTVNSQGCTAIMMAVHSVNIEAINLLLENEKVDVNTPLSMIMKSIQKAVKQDLEQEKIKKMMDIVELLIQREDIVIVDKSSGDIRNEKVSESDVKDLFLQACKNGKINLIKLLLAKGNIGLNQDNDLLQNTISLAQKNQHEKVVVLLHNIVNEEISVAELQHELKMKSHIKKENWNPLSIKYMAEKGMFDKMNDNGKMFLELALREKVSKRSIIALVRAITEVKEEDYEHLDIDDSIKKIIRREVRYKKWRRQQYDVNQSDKKQDMSEYTEEKLITALDRLDNESERPMNIIPATQSGRFVSVFKRDSLKSIIKYWHKQVELGKNKEKYLGRNKEKYLEKLKLKRLEKLVETLEKIKNYAEKEFITTDKKDLSYHHLGIIANYSGVVLGGKLFDNLSGFIEEDTFPETMEYILWYFKKLSEIKKKDEEKFLISYNLFGSPESIEDLECLVGTKSRVMMAYHKTIQEVDDRSLPKLPIFRLASERVMENNMQKILSYVSVISQPHTIPALKVRQGFDRVDPFDLTTSYEIPADILWGKYLRYPREMNEELKDSKDNKKLNKRCKKVAKKVQNPFSKQVSNFFSRIKEEDNQSDFAKQYFKGSLDELYKKAIDVNRELSSDEAIKLLTPIINLIKIKNIVDNSTETEKIEFLETIESELEKNSNTYPLILKERQKGVWDNVIMEFKALGIESNYIHKFIDATDPDRMILISQSLDEIKNAVQIALGFPRVIDLTDSNHVVPDGPMNENGEVVRLAIPESLFDPDSAVKIAELICSNRLDYQRIGIAALSFMNHKQNGNSIMQFFEIIYHIGRISLAEQDDGKFFIEQDEDNKREFFEQGMVDLKFIAEETSNKKLQGNINDIQGNVEWYVNLHNNNSWCVQHLVFTRFPFIEATTFHELLCFNSPAHIVQKITNRLPHGNLESSLVSFLKLGQNIQDKVLSNLINNNGIQDILRCFFRLVDESTVHNDESECNYKPFVSNIVCLAAILGKPKVIEDILEMANITGHCDIKVEVEKGLLIKKIFLAPNGVETLSPSGLEILARNGMLGNIIGTSDNGKSKIDANILTHYSFQLYLVKLVEKGNSHMLEKILDLIPQEQILSKKQILSKNMRNVLMKAALSNNENMFELFKRLANIDIMEVKDSQGKSALMVAISHKKKAAVKMLIEKGANYNESWRNYNSILKTPIDIAIEGRCHEIVELLLEVEDININYVNSDSYRLSRGVGVWIRHSNKKVEQNLKTVESIRKLRSLQNLALDDKQREEYQKEAENNVKILVKECKMGSFRKLWYNNIGSASSRIIAKFFLKAFKDDKYADIRLMNKMRSGANKEPKLFQGAIEYIVQKCENPGSLIKRSFWKNYNCVNDAINKAMKKKITQDVDGFLKNFSVSKLLSDDNLEEKSSAEFMDNDKKDKLLGKAKQLINKIKKYVGYAKNAEQFKSQIEEILEVLKDNNVLNDFLDRNPNYQNTNVNEHRGLWSGLIRLMFKRQETVSNIIRNSDIVSEYCTRVRLQTIPKKTIISSVVKEDKKDKEENNNPSPEIHHAHSSKVGMKAHSGGIRLAAGG